jgi:hypothetical protein
MLTLRPRLRTTSLSTQPSAIQWSFQEPIDWRYLPHIRPIKGDIPLKYGLKYGTLPPFSDPGILIHPSFRIHQPCGFAVQMGDPKSIIPKSVMNGETIRIVGSGMLRNFNVFLVFTIIVYQES